jgi:hypothetical protein
MTVEDRLWETADELQARVAEVRRPSIPGRMTPRGLAWKTLAAAGGIAVLPLLVWLVSVVNVPVLQAPAAELSVPATEEAPLNWVWKSEFESVELDRPASPDDYYYNPSRTDLIEPAQGCDVEPAVGFPMSSVVSSQTLVFNGDRFFFTVGLDSVPEVWLSGGDGTRTNLGNPFGPDEWVCHVSNTEEVFLAVGSGVWWSADGLVWNVIDAFDSIGGPYVRGSTLILSGSGPLGYVVLSQDRLNNWYSVDLVSWFRITPTGVPETALERPFGSYGLASIFMSDDFIAVGADQGVWVGTPRVEEK